MDQCDTEMTSKYLQVSDFFHSPVILLNILKKI